MSFTSIKKQTNMMGKQRAEKGSAIFTEKKANID